MLGASALKPQCAEPRACRPVASHTHWHPMKKSWRPNGLFDTSARPRTAASGTWYRLQCVAPSTRREIAPRRPANVARSREPCCRRGACGAPRRSLTRNTAFEQPRAFPGAGSLFARRVHRFRLCKWPLDMVARSYCVERKEPRTANSPGLLVFDRNAARDGNRPGGASSARPRCSEIDTPWDCRRDRARPLCCIARSTTSCSAHHHAASSSNTAL